VDEVRAQYLKVVEARFVALRGRGWMLSPRDVALVDGWRQQGLPVRVVLRVLEEGMMRFRETHPRGASLPSTLAYFDQQMLDAASVRRSKLLDFSVKETQGASAESDQEHQENVARLLDRIVAWGRSLEAGQEAAKVVLRDVWQRLKRSSKNGDLWGLVAELDVVLIDGLLNTCDPETKRALVDAAEEDVTREGSRLGPQARADRMRVALEGRVRRHFEVEDLMEVLLGTAL
jgi:hypothetical protein